MKIINFTAVEILPALLDRNKTQTIRPAWSKKSLVTIKEKPTTKEVKKFQKALKNVNVKNEIVLPPDYNVKLLLKPPRFKVGEEIKLMWGQRSEYKWFCKRCGDGIYIEKPRRDFMGSTHCCNCDNTLTRRTNGGQGNWKPGLFNKTLGTAIITEVFEIEMGQNEDNIWARPIKGISFSFDDLAERDGFKSVEKMFAWFDKTYNLSSPKKFYVYRWRWRND